MAELTAKAADPARSGAGGSTVDAARAGVRPLTRLEARRALRRPETLVRGGSFALKLCVCVLLAIGGGLFSAQPAVLWRVTGTIMLGCVFAHAAELQHEALHNLGFASRRANTVAGVMLGVPMLIAFSAYRVAHLRHHRDLGTPRNREFFDYGDQYGAFGARSRAATAFSWAIRMSLALHYRQFAIDVVRAVRGGGFPGESPAVSRRIRRDLLVIAAALLGAGAISAVSGSAFVVWQWLLPLLLVAGPVHAAIELPEHFRCDTLSEDPFANTRTIRSNRFMRWFTNGNNFHVEHHLMPNLPIGRLAELHVEVGDQIRYLHPGYLEFARSLVRARKGRDSG